MKLEILVLLFPAVASATNTLPPIHYPLTRRSGSFPAPDTANLTCLLKELDAISFLNHATVLPFRSDGLVRKPRHLHGTQASSIHNSPRRRRTRRLLVCQPTYRRACTGTRYGYRYANRGLVGLKYEEWTREFLFGLQQWIRALGLTGSYLGLAPGSSLSQTKTKGSLMQLLESKVINTSLRHHQANYCWESGFTLRTKKSNFKNSQ